ncbi:MAG: ribonuclease HI [Planctomycetes bacterium RBG_16_64_12]|nr:MAG: ribonuclease HI [Planctomycetes bacterium RBG_16_64_12]
MTQTGAADRAEVQLFTDGACSGNPGPGGWAFVLRHPASGKEMERSGAARETTNNRMELLAVIHGLEALKRPTRVELISDSVYVGKGLSEWLPKWKANGWRRREGKRLKEIKNEDLWRRLDRLLAQHQVRFTHVRGHAGHPENERCDTLAVAACQRYLA